MSNYTAHAPARNSIEGRMYVDMVKRFEIAYSDFASGVYRIPIDAGRLVDNVRVITLKAFSAANATVKVGDTSTTDGFLKTTDIDTQTVNAVVQSRNKATLVAGAKPTFVSGAFTPNVPATHAADVFTSNDPAGVDSYVQGAFVPGAAASHAADTFTDGTLPSVTFNAFAQGKYYATAGQVLLTLAGDPNTTGVLGIEIVESGYVPAGRDEMAEV